MYKYASIVYLICFAIFVLYSRQPDFTDSETTPGQVVSAARLPGTVLQAYKIKNTDRPVVEFRVGDETFYINGSSNVLLKANDPQGRVTVIYNTNNPVNAAVYQFWGYWLQLNELVFSLGGFVILLGVAVAITGKKQPASLHEPAPDNRTKYN